MGPDGLNDMLRKTMVCSGCFFKFYFHRFYLKRFWKSKRWIMIWRWSRNHGNGFFFIPVWSIFWCNLVDITVSFYVLKLVKVCFFVPGIFIQDLIFKAWFIPLRIRPWMLVWMSKCLASNHATLEAICWRRRGEDAAKWQTDCDFTMEGETPPPITIPEGDWREIDAVKRSNFILSYIYTERLVYIM